MEDAHRPARGGYRVVASRRARRCPSARPQSGPFGARRVSERRSPQFLSSPVPASSFALLQSEGSLDTVVNW